MEKLVKIALQAGAFKAHVLKVAEIPFDAQLRKLCEDNLCGKFGRNYGCPPFVGTPEKVIDRAKQYEYALIMQTVNPLEDSYDVEGMAEAGARHNAMSTAVYAQMKDEYPDSLLLTAGGCTRCERCAARDNEPCRHPEEEITPSLSSFCINVSQTAGKCGMKYINGVNTVTYFSVVLV